MPDRTVLQAAVIGPLPEAERGACCEPFPSAEGGGSPIEGKAACNVVDTAGIADRLGGSDAAPALTVSPQVVKLVPGAVDRAWMRFIGAGIHDLTGDQTGMTGRNVSGRLRDVMGEEG